MFRRIREWFNRNKYAKQSEIQVYASRTTTFPLEECNADNLMTAAAYDRRKARQYEKLARRPNKRANIEWYEMAADALESLAEKLKPGQTVGALPWRKRKQEVHILLRMTTGKAK